MKILWEPQFSSIDKRTGMFKIESDSNFVFALNLLKEFTKYADVTVMVPHHWQRTRDGKEFALLREAGADCVTTEFSVHHARSRFFPLQSSMSGSLTVKNFDLIFCNDPTHVANWKQLSDLPVITYNHWVCSIKEPKNYPTYAFRQVEGYYLADLVLCNSVAHRIMIKNQMYDLLKAPLVRELSKKVKILPPSIDEDAIRSVPRGQMTNTILFNHRMSSFPEYAENRKLFFKVINELRSDPRLVFNVVATNPSGYDPKILGLPSYVELRDFPRDEYVKFLATRPITCAFYSDKRAWCMSLSEANAFGSASVVPAHSAFWEMYPRDYSGLYEKIESAKALLKMLLEFPHTRQYWGEMARDHQLKNFSNKVLARKLWEMIEELNGAKEK